MRIIETSDLIASGKQSLFGNNERLRMGRGKVSINGVELFNYRIIMDYLEGRLSRLAVVSKFKVSE